METLLKYNYVLRDTNARPKIEQCTNYSCQRKHIFMQSMTVNFLFFDSFVINFGVDDDFKDSTNILIIVVMNVYKFMRLIIIYRE